jgi:hypothetical protein
MTRLIDMNMCILHQKSLCNRRQRPIYKLLIMTTKLTWYTQSKNSQVSIYDHQLQNKNTHEPAIETCHIKQNIADWNLITYLTKLRNTLPDHRMWLCKIWSVIFTNAATANVIVLFSDRFEHRTLVSLVHCLWMHTSAITGRQWEKPKPR